MTVRSPNPIADSMAAAPPGQTVEEWSRTSIEGQVLLLMRSLTPEGQKAFIQAGQRMVDGMPIHEVARLAFQESGMSEAEVAKAMAGLPTPAGEV